MWLMESNLRFNFPSGYTSFVLYYPRCNCNCFYCYLNKIFVNCIQYDYSSLVNSLAFIDCLVVSGGEPLLAFDDVLKFQNLAKKHDLWFYVYTNGYDANKIDKLLRRYDRTKIVIDVKGGSVEQINKTTKTSLGINIIETYNKFKNHENVIFRISNVIGDIPFDFTNVERYNLIDIR